MSSFNGCTRNEASLRPADAVIAKLYAVSSYHFICPHPSVHAQKN